MSTLVIGYGNSLRGDDAAGITAAERIAARYDGVVCVCAHQLGPELAERISQHEAVVFLDASVQQSTLQMHRIEGEQRISAAATHASSPMQLLALSEALYGRTPRQVWLVEIPAYDFDFGQVLSPGTTRWVHKCVESFDSILKVNSNTVAPEC